MHRHERGQFSFSDKELLKVFADNAYWYIPPNQTIWIPPMIEHEIFCTHDYPCIFNLIDPSECHRFSKRPCVCIVSPLVEELAKRCIKFGFSYKKNSHEFELAKVLIDELCLLPESKLKLPMARDERLKRVLDLLIKDFAGKYELDKLAKIACMSKRSLERLFIEDTGMSAGEWRRQYKVLIAIEKLSKGEAVSSIAIDLGYKSLSAFIEIFKGITGKTPSSFLVD